MAKGKKKIYARVLMLVDKFVISFPLNGCTTKALETSTTLMFIRKNLSWRVLPRDVVIFLDPRRTTSVLLLNDSMVTGIASSRQAALSSASNEKPKSPLVKITIANILCALQTPQYWLPDLRVGPKYPGRKVALCRTGSLRQEKLTRFSRAIAV